MKSTTLAAIAALGVALSGCASVIKGTYQPVAISSPPVDGANCTFYNSEGTWSGTTPSVVRVHRTKNDLKIVCKKDGYQEATKVVESHFNGATAGNIILGGGVGIVVDAATGADYSYPESVEVPMTPVNVTPAASAAPAASPVTAAPPSS